MNRFSFILNVCNLDIKGALIRTKPFRSQNCTTYHISLKKLILPQPAQKHWVVKKSSKIEKYYFDNSDLGGGNSGNIGAAGDQWINENKVTSRPKPFGCKACESGSGGGKGQGGSGKSGGSIEQWFDEYKVTSKPKTCAKCESGNSGKFII